MQETRLREVVVEAVRGDRPDEVAAEWARRLVLQDGVRVSVVWSDAPTRPRRFVVHGGQITSPQRYAALTITAALEDLLRSEGGALDAWEILMAARRRGSPVADVSMATIRCAARLLVRERRLRPGPTRGTWVAPRTGDAAA